jgi:hypothetical protein
MPQRKASQSQPAVTDSPLDRPEDLAPFTEQAATISAGSPPAATKPAMRPPTHGFDPTTVVKKRSTQLDAVITLYPPAMGRTSSLGTSLLSQCALANGLGNQEPSKVHVGFSEDKTQVFLMPVGPLANLGVEVSYYQGRALISLWQAFQESGKVVEDGFREQYNLWKTDKPVTIHGTTGYAAYFSMEHRDKERISTRGVKVSEVAPKPKKASAAKGAATTSAAKEETETPDQALWEDVYIDIIGEREEQIKELEKRLKEYEQKFGPLPQ